MANSRWQHQEEIPGDRLEVDPALVARNTTEPVSRIRLPDGRAVWLVTGWAETRQVFTHPAFSRTRATGLREKDTEPTFMLDMDPPQQSRIRSRAVGAFTHRRIEQLRPRSEQVADALLDAMAAEGEPGDLVGQFAQPLPLTVMCDLLGVPAQDRAGLQPWSEVLLSLTAHTQEEIDAACAGLDTYMSGLLRQRRAEPTDDLLSALVHDPRQDGDDPLSDDELVHLGVSLLVSGFPATASQITNFSYTLLSRPELWRQVRDAPELVPRVVEELLRFVPLGSDAGLPRVATEDVEVGGRLIRAGETVMVSRPSANRDRAVFPRPDEIVLDRADNPHLAFGFGIHHCLGVHLARLELQVAVGRLVARFPELRLAVPEDQLEWRTGLVVRGLRKLPVVWTTASPDHSAARAHTCP
ncbi:putative cytochrome P450 [Streptomyces sp. NBRC 110611]|uniref:cytochrome P450 n=1 Tax=Streptomyces sp. NBRC 110611 TaxID=1621259 RepID=UPI00082D82B6|nr:cytochrome P450 [Streptomyces sp. NBRC 110611]GAU65947.1 putative cytochrome P450 [Streptomyces sp. NBRC 110611]